jgi:hypothetical protein
MSGSCSRLGIDWSDGGLVSGQLASAAQVRLLDWTSVAVPFDEAVRASLECPTHAVKPNEWGTREEKISPKRGTR